MSKTNVTFFREIVPLAQMKRLDGSCHVTHELQEHQFVWASNLLSSHCQPLASQRSASKANLRIGSRKCSIKRPNCPLKPRVLRNVWDGLETMAEEYRYFA
jgi:hypothetical protein